MELSNSRTIQAHDFAFLISVLIRIWLMLSLHRSKYNIFAFKIEIERLSLIHFTEIWKTKIHFESKPKLLAVAMQTINQIRKNQPNPCRSWYRTRCHKFSYDWSRNKSPWPWIRSKKDQNTSIHPEPKLLAVAMLWLSLLAKFQSNPLRSQYWTRCHKFSYWNIPRISSFAEIPASKPSQIRLLSAVY